MHTFAPRPAPLHVALPGLPPSVNHAYTHSYRGGKRPNESAAAWSTGAILAIRAAAAVQGGVWPRQQPLALYISFEAPRLFEFDLDNRVKFLQDAIMAALALDDRYILTLQVTKAHAAVAATAFTLYLRPAAGAGEEVL